MPAPRRLLLVTTGGTIAGFVSEDRVDDPRDAISDVVAPAISQLERRLESDICVEYVNVFDLDSSNVGPSQWMRLAELVRDRYDDYDTFLITHGTNTLGYTCAALSFAIFNPGKPIVLTGSQVPAGMPGSDAATNLHNALRVALLPARGDLPPLRGVMAVFGSQIITGTRVKKVTEFDYDAFESFGVASIGRIGRSINIDEASLRRHLSYHSSPFYTPAIHSRELRYDIAFDMRIASLTEFPGMSSDLFATLVEGADVQGFILRSFGAGDPAEVHLDTFKYLKGRKIPIVVLTQVPRGNSNFQVNEPGRLLRLEELAIPAFDMSIEAVTTKLAWLLARKTRGVLSYEQLGVEMVTDLRGEINVVWELGL